MLFSDKKELLGLYNAVSGKQYKDPGALNVNILENAIYMAIKNDLSFVIDSRLSLYEHQSTYSPNLPLRMLLYLADLYADLTKNENLYGRKKVMLPPPQFIIFYNGEEKQPDRRILKLSDLYQVEEEEHKLELEAVECTITECIREGILEEFLRKYRAEAKRMSIYEYDQARHIRQEREEAWEEGWQEGRRDIAINMSKMGMTVEQIAQAVGEKTDIVEKWLKDGDR